ncbi:MAG: PASTA domain-containing protein [Clostridia bacterium]|nr:PASTA domain-containing protein [Clostridia bacterium]
MDRRSTEKTNQKKKRERTSSTVLVRRRAGIAFAALALIMLANIVNLGRVQIVQNEYYSGLAKKNQMQDTEIEAARGVIYDAKKTILAESASVWLVYINPRSIADEDSYTDPATDEPASIGFREALCQRLADITGVAYEEILEKAERSSYSDLTIKRQIELEERDRIAELMSSTYEGVRRVQTRDGITEKTVKVAFKKGVGLKTDVKRYYPYSTLAANVLGFVQFRDEDYVGRSGIESYYNTVLSGTPGRIISALDGRSGTLDDEYETIFEAQQGHSLVLTIDEVIQRYLESSLTQAYINAQAKGAYGAIMNSKTGAILAMACIESYDLNDPQHLDASVYEYIAAEGEKEDTEELDENQRKSILEEFPDDVEAQAAARRRAIQSKLLLEKWRVPIVTDIYYPGSCFKPLLAAAAIEEGAVSLEDFNYSCGGAITIAGETFHCHNESGHGPQNLKQGLMNSCNPFFITVGQKLGSEKYYEYFEAYGFTEKTGIDLPDETRPAPGVNYYTQDRLGKVELASCSFGQSFQITPIQMLNAINCIASGGYLMTPYLVAQELDENGNVVAETEPTVKRQVFSRETAATVADMMEGVVISGTGKNAYVPGYRLAGKTGTSQKYNNSADKKNYIASFVCFAPADDPEISMILIIDEPVGQINGGQICTPVAAQVAEKTLEYLGVERQYNDDELAHLDENTPNLVNRSLEDAKALLEARGFEAKVIGEGDTVVRQMPGYNQTVPKGGVVVLYTEEDAERLMVKVPELTEMTLSQATKAALAAGLNIRISGNSLEKSELVSYSQSSEAGSEVEYGEVVTVYFKSNTGVDDFVD